MNVRSNFVTLKQMTRDTFRQACASGICWMMLTVTGICVVLCLSVNVSGDVSLHDDDEPVLFLPQPSARAVGCTSGRGSNGWGFASYPILTLLGARESKRSAAE